MRRKIPESVLRKLYSESMGRCMNPDCKEELFKENGDIIEKAHIRDYCETKDNSFENLIVLCPNCHTNFDKNSAFTHEQVKMWKQLRRDELESFFSISYNTFEEMSKEVKPLLVENKTIYENYYLGDKKELWNIFECKILANNGKLKKILENNLNLIQRHSDKELSNLEIVNLFLVHISEFEATRLEDEKNRCVLFPAKINSIFGIDPLKKSFIPSVEWLEALLIKLIKDNKFEDIVLGIDDPYILLKKDNGQDKIYLKDEPRLRQLYYDYKCFGQSKVRLDSLNFAMKYIRTKKLKFEFLNIENLREISVKGVKVIFVYEYCLSKAGLMEICPEDRSILVNLHNWNGACCISNEAYEMAKKMDVTLLTMSDYYVYINKLKAKK